MRSNARENQAWEVLEECSPEVALCRVTMGRDTTDSYAISIKAAPGHSTPLDKADVIPLLPAGSRWSQAEGWHSYFGIPLQAQDRMWLAIGAEVVEAHPTRGAVPTVRALLFSFDEPPVEGLRAMASAVHPSIPEGQPTVTSSIFGTVLRGAGATPDQHAAMEARILRSAAYHYRWGHRLLFRTLILSEQQLMRPGQPGPHVSLHRTTSQPCVRWEQFLFGTTEPLRTTFSRKTRTWLRLNQSV